jgi:HPt (histidine-containing phosphotransfer) domain-containing protein
MKGYQEQCLTAGMDGYLSKPMKAEELYAVINSVLSAGPEPRILSGKPPVNLSAFMRSVDNDKELLLELVAVFIDYYPGRLGELWQAIRNGDAKQTQRTAHSLKGALASFGAETAYTLVEMLETMGREAQLDRAATALQQLEYELKRIIAFFAQPQWEAGV